MCCQQPNGWLKTKAGTEYIRLQTRESSLVLHERTKGVKKLVSESMNKKVMSEVHHYCIQPTCVVHFRDFRDVAYS